jgi:hypothetical protein
MMMRIDLEEAVWRNVLACLAEAPWKVSNPLIMEIGAQLQRQAASSGNVTGTHPPGNSQDHSDDLPRQ